MSKSTRPSVDEHMATKKKQTEIAITVDYWKEDGLFIGQLRDIPNVLSQGKTLESLKANMRDAFQLYVRQ